MTRFVAVSLVVLGLAVTTRTAHADGDPLPNGATLSFFKFYIRENKQYIEFRSPDQLRRYFNLAHCTCGQSNAGDETTFAYDLMLTTVTGVDRPVEVWVGTNCNDDQLRATQCAMVDSVEHIDSIPTTNGPHIEIPTYKAININTPGACVTKDSATVWLMFDRDGNGTYDHWVTNEVAKPAGFPAPSGIDVKPPPLPTNFRASGGEGAIVIEWDPPSGTTDLFAFQALCALSDDTAVGKTTIPEPRYQRPFEVCQANTTVALTQSLLDLPDETPVTAAPAPFERLDPAFLCGDSDSGTAQSLKIEGLENGVPYKVALLAVDAYGNATGTYFSTTITPKPATDFWEDLNDRDSAIDGGCLLARTYGDGGPLTQALRAFRDETLAKTALGRWLTTAYYATLGRIAVESLPARIVAGILLAPLVALALLWHLLTLPGLLLLCALPWLWRRRGALLASRRARAVFAAVALAVVLLGPGPARADDLSPYWEDPGTDQRDLSVPGDVKWNAGLRLGPYTPDVDLQFSQNAITGLGPYAAMFGDYYVDGKKHSQRVYQVMPMLDVDRIVWSGFGQLGVGGSLGYMQKTAYAYADGTTENDPMRERSTAAKTTFRLIPLAATVTYRLTYLDDRWGIPIVPYVRGGLSYYVWWMKAPDGNLSKVCDAMAADGTCTDEDKAYGGTPGVQVSAGLAIRAERIDADAARSMRNSGLEHAGFYGEVFWGRVDGFGSDTKLWVGDTTWFAGVNFEF